MRLLVEIGLPLAAASSAPAARSTGRSRRGRATSCSVVSEIKEVDPVALAPGPRDGAVRSETRNQRDEVVQVLMAKLIVPRRAATSPQPHGELAAG